MLTPATAIYFHRAMGVGKTAPSQVTCVQPDGNEVELVVKFAGGCEGGIGSRLWEAPSVMMATDLDLPVPQAFLMNNDIQQAKKQLPNEPILGRNAQVRESSAVLILWKERLRGYL